MGDSNYLNYLTTTIAADTSLSAAIEMDRFGVVRLYVPTSWTAASLTFQVSEDSINYSELYDSSGNEVTVTVPTPVPSTGVAGVALSLGPTIFGLGFRWLKVRSGTYATSVSQNDSVTITLAVRPL